MSPCVLIAEIKRESYDFYGLLHTCFVSSSLRGENRVFTAPTARRCKKAAGTSGVVHRLRELRLLEGGGS